MPLSLNEIKKRAVAFSKEWEHESSEDAEAKSFWDGFFNVFGIPRRRVASFEQQVKKQDQSQGYIDLLWKSKLLIEHKSRGKDLERAYKQAKDYFPGLKDEELPRYILVCDFQNFRLYDLDENKDYCFTLNKLVDNVRLFDFISGHIHHRVREQNPVNIEAAEMMGKLHDKLKEAGYTGHQLELYLVRLVFCLFADDTNIFEQGIFYDLLDQRTKVDGSDLAGWLASLFDVLDTHENERFKNLDEDLAAFPYVNGKLFEEQIRPASFDSEMRAMLIKSCSLDWSAISPAIFGSLFQSAMDEKARRNLGAHYTSEENILKLIKPLFLDELYEEFNKVKNNSTQLERFHAKLSELRFLDPACGCGNFLIVAYRELRLLEIELLKAKFKNQIATNIELYVLVNVDQFYGIEYEEFPAQIAQVAMWLIDHQMNRLVSDAFGDYFRRLPLTKSAIIENGNALRTDWHSLLSEDMQYNYILGNPPFIGHQWRNEEQMKDMDIVFGNANRAGRLDYVAAWYLMASKYMQTYNNNVVKIVTAFVSTNSISQGEQVGILWGELYNKYHVKIHFAHRTFKWTNEARGKAAVHVVIIGFANFDTVNKKIFTYQNVNEKEVETIVRNINPYLTEGRDIFIESRNSKPIHSYPPMIKGNQPTDGGYLVLSENEKNELINVQPDAKRWIKKYLGALEFINNTNRYCLWLKDIQPNELRNMPAILVRLQRVKEIRLKSPTQSVREYAKYPHLFTQIRQPETVYIVVPEVSSINRDYIPIGFLTPDIICSNKLQMIPNGSLYLYGILQSGMHMSWTRYVCGRMKSDFSYSPSVYHNYPFPEKATEKQIAMVEEAAQEVLNARAQFSSASLADLYDPNTMPPELVKAHQKLDRAVDLCYRPQPFPDETRRIEFLFELYDKYTAGLFKEDKKKKKKSIEIPQSLTSNLESGMKEYSLHYGIYSISDTASITGFKHQKISSWFKELVKANYEGLSQQEKTDAANLKISFHGLIELVVIGTLRNNGFALRKILNARKDLANKTGKIYPFATNNVKDKLRVAGSDIVFEIANGIIITLDGRGQINIDIIKEFFRDIIFNLDGVAQRLMPARGKGKVVIDPKLGLGKPIVLSKEVPVDTVVDYYHGPTSVPSIMKQFDITEEEVLAAVSYMS